MLELTWCLPGEAAGHVSLVSSVLVAERPVPLPPRAPGVTGRIDCAQSLAPVGPGQRRGPRIHYFTVQVRELPQGEQQTYSSSIHDKAKACAVERYPAPGAPSPGNRAGNMCGPETHPGS